MDAQPCGECIGLSYSLSPAVLEDQISASLKRLGVKKIDILMIHNPEELMGAFFVRSRLKDQRFNSLTLYVYS